MSSSRSDVKKPVLGIVTPLIRETKVTPIVPKEIFRWVTLYRDDILTFYICILIVLLFFTGTKFWGIFASFVFTITPTSALTIF